MSGFDLSNFKFPNITTQRIRTILEKREEVLAPNLTLYWELYLEQNLGALIGAELSR
jgi:hypothetical protein